MKLVEWILFANLTKIKSIKTYYQNRVKDQYTTCRDREWKKKITCVTKKKS